MSISMDKKIAKEVVDLLVKDLCNRRGLRQEWEGIDDDIRKEIREKWISLILDIFEENK